MLPQLERTTATAWSQWRLSRETQVQEALSRDYAIRNHYAANRLKPSPEHEAMFAHNRRAVQADLAEQAKVNQFFVGEFQPANDEHMDAH